MYYTSLISKKIDLSQIDRKNISQAFIVNLPFRLRVGSELRLNIGDEESAVVIFRNAIEIPTEEAWNEMHTRIMGSWDELWTKCLIILHTPTIKRDDLNAIKEGGEAKLTNKVLLNM